MVSTLLLCAYAYADDLETEVQVSECNSHSETAPESCVCLSEVKVLDAVAEIKVCRKNKNSWTPSDMGWIERSVWIVASVVAVLTL